MLIPFTQFVVVSLLLIPAAWVIGIKDKLSQVNSMKNKNDKMMNVFIFIPFGIPILFCDLLTDCLYFWVNNFKTDLRKVIIERQRSKISHSSLKEIMQMMKNYSDNKIGSMFTRRFVDIYGRILNVSDNIKYLIFGQMIPEGGFKEITVAGKFNDNKSYFTMKTQDLID